MMKSLHYKVVYDTHTCHTFAEPISHVSGEKLSVFFQKHKTGCGKLQIFVVAVP